MRFPNGVMCAVIIIYYYVRTQKYKRAHASTHARLSFNLPLYILLKALVYLKDYYYQTSPPLSTRIL